MTNGDKIRATKTNSELADAILGAVEIGKKYPDPRIGIVKWLSEEDEVPQVLSIIKKPIHDVEHGAIVFVEDTKEYYIFDKNKKLWEKMFVSEDLI